MNIEFFKNENVFTHPVMFRELGSTEWHPVTDLDENKQRQIFELCRDNRDISKYIDYLRSRNKQITISEMLQQIIVKFFGKLDKIWDIDESTLNIELN